MVISKKTINFQGFRGVPIFSRGGGGGGGSNLFQGGGVQMLISIETDRALGNAELRVLVRTFFPWDA